MGIYSLVLFLSFQISSIEVVTKDYVIFHGDNIIGTIKAQKTAEKDSTRYVVTSKVAYHSLLYNMDRNTLTKVSFYKSLMGKSYSFIEKNGKVEGKCDTKYDGKKYVQKSIDGDMGNIPEKITWCTSMLYFEEPVNTTEIFAEAYQEVCPLVKTETPHVYELTLPGNKKNDYVYKDGKLVEVKVHRTLVNLSFRPKP